MFKELYIDAHEALIEEYMDAHPNATEQEAYDATADGAYDRMTDTVADRIDYLRALAKEG